MSQDGTRFILGVCSVFHFIYTSLKIYSRKQSAHH